MTHGASRSHATEVGSFLGPRSALHWPTRYEALAANIHPSLGQLESGGSDQRHREGRGLRRSIWYASVSAPLTWMTSRRCRIDTA